MSNDNSGTVDVELDRQQMLHLLNSGTSAVTESVGPIDVRISTDTRLNATLTVDELYGDEDPTEIQS